MKPGKVYLLGAGPGDPELMTQKGVTCLHKADVVIYDHLASAKLLRYARVDAETVYVGKEQGSHTLPQDEMNALLVEKASQGNIVVRLKGGHPFIFGRGGEEAEALVDAGIPFEIIPGITSAIAAPSYAGIPLTHRKYSASIGIVTGHEDPTKPKSNIDWGKLATGVGTLVVLMGVKNLPHIVGKVLEAGRAPDTPVALVRWGTTPKQTTLVGTLENIVEKAKKANLKPPVAIVVGEVVHLRKKLNWFEKKPLFGHTIVITRTRSQASDLVIRLSGHGANCLECPTIQVTAPDSWQPLDEAIDRLHTYDWLVLTSVNGVEFFFQRLFQKGKDVRSLGNVRTATIGPATAERLRKYGFHSDIIPKTYRAESIIEAFEKQPMAEKRVLLPRAKEARPILPVEVRKMGAHVDEVPAYQTEKVTDSVETLVKALEKGSVDMVTFTSSSTVKNFKALLPDDRFHDLIEGVKFACIGPITADTARALGLSVDVEATEFTIPGLVDAILDYYT